MFDEVYDEDVDIEEMLDVLLLLLLGGEDESMDDEMLDVSLLLS